MRISFTNILISACLLATPVSSKVIKSSKQTLPSNSAIMASASKAAVPSVPAGALPDAAKLVIGAGGIYAAFLYYGTLQEDVFHYVASDGSKFKAAWFLQTLGISWLQIQIFYSVQLCAMFDYSNNYFFFMRVTILYDLKLFFYVYRGPS
jgi:hypothetical protein